MKYRNLDVLRALAVSYVFLNHVTLELFRSPNLVFISGALGRFGVILFFIHTSLVLMQSMESLARKSTRWILQFYVRRVFRIYPLAIVVVLLAVYFHIPFAPWEGPQTAGLNTKGIILNLLLLQNIARVPSAIGPLWTLPIEVQMYALLPFVFMVVHQKKWVWKMVLCWIAAGSIAGIVYWRTGRMNLLEFTGCFLCGAIAYKLKITVKPAWSFQWWIPAILVATVGGVVWTLDIPIEWAICLGLALLFPRVGDIPEGWFSNSCHLVAKYSYGIYLSNLIACWIAFHLIGIENSAAQIVVAIVITAVASVATYHLVEDPLIELGKRLSDQLKAPVQPQPVLADN